MMAARKMTDGSYVRLHNCLYAVEFNGTRIHLLKSKKFVLGQSELSDFVISSNDVATKQCDIVYSRGSWMLHNFSNMGTRLSGRFVLKDEVHLCSHETMNFGEVRLIIVIKMDLKHPSMHLLKIIPLKGKHLCCLAAEDQLRGLMKQNNPEDLEYSRFEECKPNFHAEASLAEKDAIIHKVREENAILKEQLKEMEAVLIRAKTAEDKEDIKVAMMGEDMEAFRSFREKFNILKQNIKKDLQCSICLELFDDAATLQCGHTFCLECVQENMTHRNNCPLCRSHSKYYCRSIVIDDLVRFFEST